MALEKVIQTLGAAPQLLLAARAQAIEAQNAAMNRALAQRQILGQLVQQGAQALQQREVRKEEKEFKQKEFGLRERELAGKLAAMLAEGKLKGAQADLLLGQLEELKLLSPERINKLRAETQNIEADTRRTGAQTELLIPAQAEAAGAGAEASRARAGLANAQLEAGLPGAQAEAARAGAAREQAQAAAITGQEQRASELFDLDKAAKSLGVDRARLENALAESQARVAKATEDAQIAGAFAGVAGQQAQNEAQVLANEQAKISAERAKRVLEVYQSAYDPNDPLAGLRAIGAIDPSYQEALLKDGGIAQFVPLPKAIEGAAQEVSKKRDLLLRLKSGQAGGNIFAFDSGALGTLKNKEELDREVKRWNMVGRALSTGRVDWLDQPIDLAQFSGLGPNTLALTLYQLAGGNADTFNALEAASTVQGQNTQGAPSVNFEGLTGDR